MFATDVWALLPGLTAARETYEAAFRWGAAAQGVITAGYIGAGAIDSGNTPTWELRPGLLLGQQISTGQWLNYNPSATDGTEVAGAVNLSAIRIQDLQGVNQPRFYALLVGGPVQAAKLLGLDYNARQQMDKFMFDDVPGGWQGYHWFPFKRFQTKTANYSITTLDDMTLFDNTGATGAVTFTLPAIQNGMMFGFRVQTDQNVLVTSNEGGNIIAFNNNVANTLAFQSAGARIGGLIVLFTNPGGTKWIAENLSIGANTITVS